MHCLANRAICQPVSSWLPYFEIGLLEDSNHCRIRDVESGVTIAGFPSVTVRSVYIPFGFLLLQYIPSTFHSVSFCYSTFRLHSIRFPSVTVSSVYIPLGFLLLQYVPSTFHSVFFCYSTFRLHSTRFPSVTVRSVYIPFGFLLLQ